MEGGCAPHPLFFLGEGGGTPQNLMGDRLKSKTWGELKMLSKTPVKEFDSKVAGYKPGFQLNFLILIEFPNILH